MKTNESTSLDTVRKGVALMVEPTANGWIVFERGGPNDAICFSSMLCFQHLDYDQQGVQSDLTLFGFLAKHFNK